MGELELWHFTCDHGHDAIGDKGELRPIVRHPMLGCKVVWVTTEADPDRDSTGLTMSITKCDRMAYRYRVTDTRYCRRWLDSPERFAAPAHFVADLERYGDVEHWYISDVPVPCVLAAHDREAR